MRRIAFIVNGSESGAMGQRASAFAQRLQARFRIQRFHRQGNKFLAIPQLLRQVEAFSPDALYIFDMAFSGVFAGTLCRCLGGVPMAIDTGDAIRELAAAIGRGRLGRSLTAVLETLSLRMARKIIVRGSWHAEWLLKRGYHAEVLPDGVECDLFAPNSESEHNTEITIGVLGSVIWNPVTRSCYGTELLEILHQINDNRFRGLVIGGGSGLPMLRQKAQEYNLKSKIEFAGQVPYGELPARLSKMDICLSTQTNDIPGRVRTTGKLPLYLAAGKYILASRVGEAARVLPPEMLVDYQGSNDPEYPRKLVDRLRTLPEDFRERGLQNVAVARAHFDYDLLADKLARILEKL